MRRTRAPFLLLLCVGCAPAPREQAAPAPAPAYIAVGDYQGGWSLRLDRERLVYDLPSGAGWGASPISEVAADQGVTRYRTPAARVTVVPGKCADAVKAAALPDAVTFEVDGGTYPGCGGPIRPTQSLLGTTWEVVRVDGLKTHDSPAAVLAFWPSGAVAGALHCNDFGTGLAFDGRAFRTVRGAGEMTAVGCPQREDPAFDRRLIDLLPKVRAWRLEGDRLRLSTDEGREIELFRLL